MLVPSFREIQSLVLDRIIFLVPDWTNDRILWRDSIGVHLQKQKDYCWVENGRWRDYTAEDIGAGNTGCMVVMVVV